MRWLRKNGATVLILLAWTAIAILVGGLVEQSIDTQLRIAGLPKPRVVYEVPACGKP